MIHAERNAVRLITFEFFKAFYQISSVDPVFIIHSKYIVKTNFVSRYAFFIHNI